jgi:hypothetical protein
MSTTTIVAQQQQDWVAWGAQSLAAGASAVSSAVYGALASDQPLQTARPTPLTDREILQRYYRGQPSVCNTLVCGNCEEPSLCLESKCCADCCCYSPYGNTNVIIIDNSGGDVGSGCGVCVCEKSNCGGKAGEACLVAALVAAAAGVCICCYQGCKTVNQLSILNHYRQQLPPPPYQDSSW